MASWRHNLLAVLGDAALGDIPFADKIFMKDCTNYKNVKAANFNIDTINQKTYVFGIAHSEEEKKEIIQEAKQIVDLKELVTSILLVSDLSRQKE